MTVCIGLIRRTPAILVGAILMLAAAGDFSEAAADSCVLSPEHAGMTFPVGQLTEDWACRLKSVVDHYTTANRVGPLKTAMDQEMYLHLLDRPPLAAALINRLDLADYKAEARGPDRWWGDDGEGAEGIVHLVHRDATTRIYYLEGTHRSRLLPNLRGKAVVFLRMVAVKGADGLEAMESTMVAYAMLENRILSGLASLLRPLIGATATRKLAKGVEVVNRLGLEMRHHPDRVLFEASDPPPLADEDVAFLKAALGTRRLAPAPGRSGRAAP
jgi:hypothetical protein